MKSVLERGRAAEKTVTPHGLAVYAELQREGFWVLLDAAAAGRAA